MLSLYVDMPVIILIELTHKAHFLFCCCLFSIGRGIDNFTLVVSRDQRKWKITGSNLGHHKQKIEEMFGFYKEFEVSFCEVGADFQSGTWLGRFEVANDEGSISSTATTLISAVAPLRVAAPTDESGPAADSLTTGTYVVSVAHPIMQSATNRDAKAASQYIMENNQVWNINAGTLSTAPTEGLKLLPKDGEGTQEKTSLYLSYPTEEASVRTKDEPFFTDLSLFLDSNGYLQDAIDSKYG